MLWESTHKDVSSFQAPSGFKYPAIGRVVSRECTVFIKAIKRPKIVGVSGQWDGFMSEITDENVAKAQQKSSGPKSPLAVVAWGDDVRKEPEGEHTRTTSQDPQGRTGTERLSRGKS